jgi:hypothetical protein
MADPTPVPQGASFISVGLQISPMFKPIIDILNLTMQLITTAIGIWGGQAMLLCFTKSSMLAILLPLGFFLRALGVKGGGNTLIGIALAMYFAYPFLITMIGDIITSHIEKEMVQNREMCSKNLWTIQKGQMCSIINKQDGKHKKQKY